MNKTIYIILLSGLISLCGFSQDTGKWINSQKPVDFQKLYLHTDREFFFEGDTLWFAAYLVNGQSHLTSNEDCNLHVDISNSEGDIVQNELFVILNGAASGCVILSREKIKEGNYILRAYTDYLKNFGNDAFFRKNIRISSVKSSLEFDASKQEGVDLVTQSSPDQYNTNGSIHQLNSKSAGEQIKIDVSFLPEGGFLLAGQSNCVAFKAIDENGKGIDVSGKIYDTQNNQVLTFKSLYKGAGKFFFIPKPGEKYTAKIEGITALTFQLPAIKQTGAKIKLVNQEPERLQLLVQASDVGQNSPYQLICMHRGEALFFMNLDEEQLNTVIRLNTNQLGSGINRFVLLDKNENPVSERLVFQNNVEGYKLDVQVGDKSYSTREEVQLNIKPSINTKSELARVSVAVVDENYTNAKESSQNIASYLLLNSELKGHIESPAGYFISDGGLDAQTKLDLLMSINGWSNYKWNTLLPKNVDFKFKPQLGFDFKGKVKRAFGNKALQEGSVFFMIQNNDFTRILDLPLNQNGTFEFNQVVFYDSASIFAQARNKRDKHTIQFELEFPKINPSPFDENLLTELNTWSALPTSVYRQRYLNEMKLQEFYPDRRHILLEDVEVKGKSYIEKWKTGTVRKGDGPYLLTPEKTAGTSDIVQYLAYKVPGVYPAKGGQSITFYPGSGRFDDPEPLFWIDYQMMLSVDEIKNYSVDMFETIELMGSPMSYFYRAPNGVVLLTTKRGRSLNERKTVLLGGAVKTIKGFTPIREFYSPKYTAQNINSEVPDFRNTLYWNPQFILGGEHEIYFNACDNVSRYKVIVEGLTESGKICIGEAAFEVDSYNPDQTK